MRSKAAQMLRKASTLLTKASREAARASSEYAELYIPGVSKRVKRLQKKALRLERDPPLPKKCAHRGWPRGYEFGTRTMTRELRPSNLFWVERETHASGTDSSSGLSW